MKRVFILVLSLLLLTWAGALAAENNNDVEKTVESGTSVDNVTAEKSKLGLSEEQMKKLKDIKSEVGSENAKLIKERNKIRNEIRTMMKADDPDYNKIEAKVRELEKVRSRIMLNKLSGAKKVNKVLTKEQRSKLKQIRAERRKRMEEKMKKMKKETKPTAPKKKKAPSK